MLRLSVHHRSFGFLLLVALATTCAGCFQSKPADQPDLGEVSGNVTLDGSPLADATVSFQSVELGRLASGKTDAQGHYELNLLNDTKGAVVGANKVLITTAQPGDDAVPGSAKPETLPKKYNDKSELTADVKEGSNEFNFDLQSK
ncbi:carboxypeptidase regulatory-like domain-containing protein [Bremerella sp. P1]|uniref:carboxypeptidase regulatory-like domain-containing protein n=1 Tax=Bremerella sp. P1 TaxID=3026424 RepID=UPI002368792F|nr:carboxypeptidase regulatory-like domain-containing protein [Bremerella sp. P1]WDI44502.1 carboxypeptidase regulatory-like domain-containing protein [Bremerella sp. P1]